MKKTGVFKIRQLKKYREQIAVGLMIVGGLLMAGFTISHQRFAAGVVAPVGAILLIGGFFLWQWPQFKAGQRRARKLVTLLGLLLAILVILEIAWIILDSW